MKIQRGPVSQSVLHLRPVIFQIHMKPFLFCALGSDLIKKD